MYSMTTIHSMLGNFIVKDLESCDYNAFQHDVNLYCYLTDLNNKVNSKFDITKDDTSVLYYLNQKLNETKLRLYVHSKINSLIN